jgi:hypothetical protein
VGITGNYFARLAGKQFSCFYHRFGEAFLLIVMMSVLGCSSADKVAGGKKVFSAQRIKEK